MQVKDQCFGLWAPYVSFGSYYEADICSFSIHNGNMNIVTPERFCKMYEKCKLLSMGYITALAQANMKQECSNDTNNISYILGTFWEPTLNWRGIALHADICYLVI